MTTFLQSVELQPMTLRPWQVSGMERHRWCAKLGSLEERSWNGFVLNIRKHSVPEPTSWVRTIFVIWSRAFNHRVFWACHSEIDAQYRNVIYRWGDSEAVLFAEKKGHKPRWTEQPWVVGIWAGHWAHWGKACKERMGLCHKCMHRLNNLLWSFDFLGGKSVTLMLHTSQLCVAVPKYSFPELLAWLLSLSLLLSSTPLRFNSTFLQSFLQTHIMHFVSRYKCVRSLSMPFLCALLFRCCRRR